MPLYDLKNKNKTDNMNEDYYYTNWKFLTGALKPSQLDQNSIERGLIKVKQLFFQFLSENVKNLLVAEFLLRF